MTAPTEPEAAEFLAVYYPFLNGRLRAISTSCNRRDGQRRFSIWRPHPEWWTCAQAATGV